MKLYYDNTDVEVKVGDRTKTFRGEHVIVDRIEEPLHSASSGRVYVTYVTKEWSQGFFPSVIGASWR